MKGGAISGYIDNGNVAYNSVAVSGGNNGQVTTVFDSSDLALSGTRFSYNSGNTYYGAHSGLGYNRSLNAEKGAGGVRQIHPDAFGR